MHDGRGWVGEKRRGGGVVLMIGYWLCLARCCPGRFVFCKGAC